MRILTALLLALAPVAKAPFEAQELPFEYQHHPTERKHLIETMGGGMAIFDYNGDGRPDLFFTNGAAVPSLQKGKGDHNRLFRNDGARRFTDVTAQAGLEGQGYSVGVAAADFDNDGDTDLFVAGVFRNLLYRNRGDGTFEEISGQSGIRSPHWSVGGGWLDYDNDGFLDLFVVNYAKWSPDFDQFCGDRARNMRVYCHPKLFSPLPNTLYRNRGDGTFEDVSIATGIAAHAGRGMSVAFADYDGDGWLDIFVPNDKLPNFLFRNYKGKRFEETALLAGAALPLDGKPVSGMGADFRDYDNDGRPDIYFTALNNETFPLLRNSGKGDFEDVTFRTGLGPLTAKYSGWSNGIVDFDNDGLKDLYSTNSHVNDRIDAFEPSAYRQPNVLFLQRDGRFESVPFGVPAVHRGGAVADLDGDGGLDIVTSALGSPAAIWWNTLERGNWLQVRLRGLRCNRDAIGAVVRIAGQANHMTTAAGYASSLASPLHFGVGLRKIVDVHISWPSGQRQTVSGLQTGQVIHITESVD